MDIAKKAYADHNGPDRILEAWVTGILDDYDPVVKYVFTKELERKGARLAESIIADAEYSGKDPPYRQLSPYKTGFHAGIELCDMANRPIRHHR